MSLNQLDPRDFSFNSPHGACPECKGLGNKLTVEPDLVMPNHRLTLAEGAIRPWSKTTSRLSWYSRILQAVAERLKIAPEKVFINVDRYGNMSSASTVVALYEAVKSGAVKKGDYVVLVAFGGGLTWGASLIKW